MKNEMPSDSLRVGRNVSEKLRSSIAKPAVQFGGHFTVSLTLLSFNCANSGIHNVGVITQYQPLALNNHIEMVRAGGLDGVNSGVSIFTAPIQPAKETVGLKGLNRISAKEAIDHRRC